MCSDRSAFSIKIALLTDWLSILLMSHGGSLTDIAFFGFNRHRWPAGAFALPQEPNARCPICFSRLHSLHLPTLGNSTLVDCGHNSTQFHTRGAHKSLSVAHLITPRCCVGVPLMVPAPKLPSYGAGYLRQLRFFGCGICHRYFQSLRAFELNNGQDVITYAFARYLTKMIMVCKHNFLPSFRKIRQRPENMTGAYIIGCHQYCCRRCWRRH